MKRNVYDYFLDLQQQEFNRENNMILLDDNFKFKDIISMDVSLFKAFNQFYFAKFWKGSKSFHAMAASKMYNDLGVLTPPIDLLLLHTNDPNNNEIYELTQAIQSIPEYQTKLACNIFDRLFDCTLGRSGHIMPRTSKYANKRHTWDFLTDQEIKEKLLTVLDKQCFEELTNIILLDELRGETDRHTANFFLIKKPDEARYSGVIPFDMNRTALITEAPTIDIEEDRIIHRKLIPITTKEMFNDFLHKKYNSCTIICTTHNTNYMERINFIRTLMHKGLLSQDNLETLKSAINYDFPQQINNTIRRYYPDNTSTHSEETFKFVWDYLQSTIGQDLSL